MKSLVLSAIVLAAASTSYAGVGGTPVANSDVLQTATLNRITGEYTIGGTNFGGEAIETVFSAIPGPYSAFAAATGPLGFDDYDSTFAGGPLMGLEELVFVGGVTTVGGTINFSFYDSRTATVPVLSEDFTFPQAGNFVWTLSGFSGPVPADGVLELTAGANTTGRWFLGADAPSIGLEDRSYGSTTTASHRFEIVVPEPTSIATLALGGLVLRRRRA